MTENFDLDEIRYFLSGKNVLVLDDKRGSRNEIKSALLELGVAPDKLHIEKDFKYAQEIMNQYNPEIIISEFQVFDNFGLDLAHIQTENIKDHSEKIFIVATNDPSQSAVADAAEEEIDAFILKPLDKEKVLYYFKRSIHRKLHPSEYTKTIQETKDLINRGQTDEALQSLRLAKFSFDKPSMAFYHSGSIYFGRKEFEKALREFEEGLDFNKIHYKCLIGKFMALKSLNKRQEAFECLEYIASKFPLTPDLLKNAFILSVLSYHYEKVEFYYNLYLNQPRKTEALKLTVSQALMTAGKILLRKKENIKKALEYFKIGAIISGRQTTYLAEVIDTLVEERRQIECTKFVNLFKVDDLGTSLYEYLKYKVFVSLEPTNVTKIIERGKDLIYKGHGNDFIFRTMIKYLKENGNDKLLENIVYKAIEVIPDNRKEYLKLAS